MPDATFCRISGHGPHRVLESEAFLLGTLYLLERCPGISGKAVLSVEVRSACGEHGVRTPFRR